MTYRFGPYELDPGSRELLRNTVQVHLTPKALQLLEMLIERRPDAVSKEEIKDHLWPSTHVTEVNLPSLVLELRHALGDDPHRPCYIRTIRGFGYAFCRPRAPERATSSGDYRLVCGDQEIHLSPGENILGRSRETAEWLDSSRVCPRHARVLVTEDAVQIEDLGSRGGTFLRDERIAGPTPLEDGDEIRLGDVTLTFCADTDSSAS
jgi:DNA-binding winged helix-turn-helix (wHTH) protein